MRLFGVVICLIALGLTGYSAIVYKAPKIQADIQARTEAALAEAVMTPVEIVVDGRTITLSGTVADDRERETLLALAGNVQGGLGPVDLLERLTVITPYRFEATKNADGDTSVEGFAPSAELRDLMRADVETIFGADVDMRIELAAGAPDGDWHGIVGLGMDALATLDQGKMTIADTELSLVGNVNSPADVEAIDIFADAAPKGFVWNNRLSVTGETIDTAEASDLVDPFTFTVRKDVDGSLTIKGFAPDEATRDAMINQAKNVAEDRPVIADIQLADGMPDENWPELVFAGIGAMAQVGAGRYDVVGNDVSFSGDVTEDSEKMENEAGPAAEAKTADLIEGDDTVDGPAIVTPYVMTVYKSDDGGFWAEGVAPDEQARDKLIAALKENFAVDEIEAEIELAGGMPGEDWQDFVVDRAIALKAINSGSLNIEDYDSHLIGVVDTPEDMDLVQTKLAAIDSAMTVDLNPIDPRPAAKLELVVSPDQGVTLWGNLPEDLTEKDVVAALGLHEYEGGLSEDGRGNAEDWRKNLAGIGGYLPQFEHVGIKLGNDGARVAGKLYPKADVEKVTEGLTDLLGTEQAATIDVALTEMTYEDNTQRKNPLTGKEEVYDRGHWLPIATFSAGLEACQKQSSDILASSKITFLRGEATLDTKAEKILDDLAAVVSNCLRGGKLALEIGGHTDSRGATDMNKELSQERAAAVRQALLARGVDQAALIAIGYGEANPIADNKTDEGRAKNRRITFEWNESGTEG